MKFVVYVLMLACLTHSALCADDICAKHVVIPEYPRIAEVARLWGTISLELTISTAGNVLSVQSSGQPLLKSAAEGNVKNWTFSQVDPTAGIRELKLKFEYVLGDGLRSVTLDLPDRVEIKGVLPLIETDTEKRRR
jgi:hypothetical protein